MRFGPSGVNGSGAFSPRLVASVPGQAGTAPHARMSTAHNAPMMRNGPNGTYDLPPDPARHQQHEQHHAREDQPEDRAAQRSIAAEQQVRSRPAASRRPVPNAPAPNGIDGRYSTAGIRTAASTASTERPARPAGSAPRPRTPGRPG